MIGVRIPTGIHVRNLFRVGIYFSRKSYKMKTYILILSQTFPKGHPSEGKPTGFGAAVVQQIKKHTIRDNYVEWVRKIDEIKAGNAVLSIRVWEGKPYRSRQLTLMDLTRDSGIGIQKLHSFDDEYGYFIGGKGNVLPIPLQELANNDGLSVKDWRGWFKDNAHLPLAIIHFTGFRYE